MRIPTTYYDRESPVHRADARVKLALLLVYSVCLFAACTWRALGVLAALLAVLLVVSRLPVGALARTLLPLYVLMAFAVAVGSFSFNPESLASAYGVSGVSAGVFANAPALAVAGGLFFVPAGCVRALFYCVRIAALVLASLLVAYSTPSTRLTGAFAWFLGPLARLRVPVDDIAFTFTLALRFIPLAFQELQQVKTAQTARGAAFQVGGLWRRAIAWKPVLVPWFVGMYRRAARIATAMDTRAYGLAGRNVRTALNPLRVRVVDAALLLAGTILCVAPCLLFA